MTDPSLPAAVARACQRIAELEALLAASEARANDWHGKYLKLAQNMRRKALGILGDIDVTPEQIVEWSESRRRE